MYPTDVSARIPAALILGIFAFKVLSSRMDLQRRRVAAEKLVRSWNWPFPDRCRARQRPHYAGDTMRFGYTVVYVPDVAASLAFFEQAFGLQRRFLHESGSYGELETGATALAFAAHALGDLNFPGGHVHADRSAQPLGFEIALVTDDVAAAHGVAVGCGATELAAPAVKPWGQTVSYLRCPNGVLVELCTPMGG